MIALRIARSKSRTDAQWNHRSENNRDSRRTNVHTPLSDIVFPGFVPTLVISVGPEDRSARPESHGAQRGSRMKRGAFQETEILWRRTSGHAPISPSSRNRNKRRVCRQEPAGVQKSATGPKGKNWELCLVRLSLSFFYFRIRIFLFRIKGITGLPATPSSRIYPIFSVS